MTTRGEAALYLAGAVHSLLDNRHTRTADTTLDILAEQYERYGRPGGDYDPDNCQIPELADLMDAEVTP